MKDLIDYTTQDAGKGPIGKLKETSPIWYTFFFDANIIINQILSAKIAISFTVWCSYRLFLNAFVLIETLSKLSHLCLTKKEMKKYLQF